MYESEFQEKVSRALIEKKTGGVDLSLTDNGLAVVVEVEGGNAAYTADEARELARDLKSTADQRWDDDADDIVSYLRDLADVVDGEMTDEEVAEKWDLDEEDHE